MKTSYEQLLSMIPSEEPRPTLVAHVLERIKLRKRRQLQTRIAIRGLLGISALISIVPTISYAIRDMSASGLYEYLSLIISDGSYLMSHWSDLALSIVSSWPIMTTVLSIALIMILVDSLRRIMSDVSTLSAFSLSY